VCATHRTKDEVGIRTCKDRCIRHSLC